MPDHARVRAARHWIFDLDGTLTVAQHDFEAIRRRLGVPPREPILEHLERLPAARAAPLRDRLHRIEAELAAASTPADGAAALLRTLLERNCRVGVLTRNSRANAMLSLERIGMRALLEAEWVLGREAVPPKPDPAGIHHLLRVWRAGTHDCVIVGDFRYDLAAGRSAGIMTVHVDATRTFAWPELTDLTVASLDELLAILAKNGSAV